MRNMLFNTVVSSFIFLSITAVAVSASAQHKVKLGGNGKAYKVNNRVPEKKDAAVSNQHKAGTMQHDLFYFCCFDFQR